MAPRGPRMAPRGPKSSRFVGVKKRGGSTSVDMRCGRRWEVSGFASDELAGLAHDFFRLLHDEPQYVLLRDEKLNFPRDRALLIRFSGDNGMARFRVVVEKDEKSWSAGKKKDFMELVKAALRRIKSVRAEDFEGAEAATAQSSAANFVQVSNDDTVMISGGEENNWDIEKALSSDDPSSYNRFNSRASEGDIYPRLKELEELLFAEKKKSSVLENQIKSLQTENKGLKQQLAGVGVQNEDNIVDAATDVQAQSEDAIDRGRVNTLQEGDQLNDFASDLEPMSNAECDAILASYYDDMKNSSLSYLPTEAGTETVQTV